jgi:hypothetical protein
VVVQAQDLLFIAGDRLVIVTTAADAAEWDAEARAFDLIHESLNVTEAVSTPTPGLTSEAQPTEQEGAQ